MKVVIIGSSFCQDTLYAINKMKDAGAVTEFRNVSTNFAHLKEFFKLRDFNPLYVEVKEKDRVGMPYFLFEDGTDTLDLNAAVAKVMKG